MAPTIPAGVNKYLGELNNKANRKAVPKLNTMFNIIVITIIHLL